MYLKSERSETSDDTLPRRLVGHRASNVAPGGGKNEPHERVLGGEVKKN